MDKKQEILMAAFDIFCKKGYWLTVAELAGAVKIKTPSLYSHFASKDEIIELVVRDEIERYYWQRKLRKEAFEQLNHSSMLPAVKENTEVSFAEIRIPETKKFVSDIIPESIRPTAVIKTATMTIALSKEALNKWEQIEIPTKQGQNVPLTV